MLNRVFTITLVLLIASVSCVGCAQKKRSVTPAEAFSMAAQQRASLRPEVSPVAASVAYPGQKIQGGSVSNPVGGSTAATIVSPVAEAETVIEGPQTVAPGFLIRLSNPNDDEVSGEFRVKFDGTLELPYGIELQVDGLSEEEFVASVRRAYTKYFRNTSIISVDIAEREYYVDVRGLVQRGGAYLARRDSGLDELIGKAGGLVEAPQARFVRVKQGDQETVVRLTEYYSGASAKLPYWKGGDTVFFQSEPVASSGNVANVDSNYVQLLGEVAAPGEYRTQEGADFFYYLVRASGPTSNADLEHVQLVRRVAGEIESVSFSTEEIDEIPQLQGGDIVIVNPQQETGLSITSTIVGIFTSIFTVGAVL